MTFPNVLFNHYIFCSKIEDIDLPEKVDIIISEPIGFLLVHERMLESYVVARDRFLKPGGLMFPTTGSIVIAPFTDFTLYSEQEAKLQFWNNNSFYGVDLTPLMEQAGDEYFTQAVVGEFYGKIPCVYHLKCVMMDYYSSFDVVCRLYKCLLISCYLLFNI